MSEAVCQKYVVESCAVILIEAMKYEMGKTDITWRTTNVNVSETRDWVITDEGTLQFTIPVSFTLKRETTYDVFPLLGFIARFWPTHLQKCLASRNKIQSDLPRMAEFFQSEQALTWVWSIYHQEIPALSTFDWRKERTSEMEKSELSSRYQSRKDDCIRYAPSGVVVNVPPLYAAIFFGLSSVVRWLLERHQVYIGRHYEAQLSSPLQLAIMKGFDDVAEILLDAGCDVNEWADSGSQSHSPLQAAASLGNTDMITKLLKSGAEIDMDRSWAKNSVALAIQRGHQNSVEALLGNLPQELLLRYLPRAINFAFWWHEMHCGIIRWLLATAKRLSDDLEGRPVLTARAVTFAAKAPVFLSECLALTSELDNISLNTTLQRMALACTSQEQLLQLVDAVLKKAAPGVVLEAETIGQFALMNQPTAQHGRDALASMNPAT